MTPLPASYVRAALPLAAALSFALLYYRPRSTYKARLRLWALFQSWADSLLPSDLRLRALSNSHRASSTLYAAAKLDVFEVFKNGALTAEEAAGRLSCSVHAESLFRILRFLASQGLFTFGERTRRFEFTEVGALLLRGPHSQLSRVLANNDPGDAGRIGHDHLEDCIKSGGCAFQHAAGKTCWEFYDTKPHLGERFEEMMTAVSDEEDANIAADYPGWSKARLVVDVAGGPGSLLRAIVRRHKHLHGHATVFERPAVVDATDAATAQQEGIGFVAGDFFGKVVPENADVYILRQILHDWGDEDCVRILRSVRNAMHAGSRLLIVDTVLLGPRDPLFRFKADCDIDMMVWTGGKERSKEDFAALLSKAGFKLLNIIELRSLKSMVEAVVIHEGPAWHETISQGVRLSRLDTMLPR